MKRVTKIPRIYRLREFKLRYKSGQDTLLENREHRGSESRLIESPSVIISQVRNRGQHIEDISVTSPHTCVCCRWTVQVEARVWREAITRKYLLEQLLPSRGEHDGVMRYVRIGCSSLKVQHVQSHRRSDSLRSRALHEREFFATENSV
jgi:hypothetical protein